MESSISKSIGLFVFITVLACQSFFANGSPLGNNHNPTLVIDRVIKDGPVITIHYTTTYLQDAQLETTNWQYSFDNGLTWIPIDASAISNNNPKPLGESTITWDTSVGSYFSNLYLLIRMQVWNPSDLGSWRTVASMPEGRGAMAVNALDSKIYVFGGFGGAGWQDTPRTATVQEYDSIDNSWRLLPPMPDERSWHTSAIFDKKIYIMGDWGSSSNIVLEYNPLTNEWRKVEDMPTGRYGLTASVVAGKIYAIGGRGGPQNWVEEYNPSTNKWQVLPEMPTGRGYLTSQAVNGKIYTVGGMGGTSAVEVYDPSLIMCGMLFLLCQLLAEG